MPHISMDIGSRKVIICALLIISALFLLLHAQAYAENKKSNYNVILIAVDTLRADHLSCYGYKRKTSPNIDKFAEGAVLFKNCIAQSSWSLPSFSSLFTSLYPTTHRVDERNQYLDNSHLTLAEILKENGYKTAAFTGGSHLNHIFGLNQGFDEYEDKIHFGSFFHSMPSAMAWLEKNRENRFFLFVHGYDMHIPYYAPLYFNELYDPAYRGIVHDEKDFFTNNGLGGFFDNIYYKNLPDIFLFRFKDRWYVPDDEAGGEFKWNIYDTIFDTLPLKNKDKEHIISHYDGALTYVDMWVGLLLNKVNQLDLKSDTIIIITSDHGEGLGENRYFRHRFDLYYNMLHVPLIIGHPDFNAGRIDALIESIDIMPTILDFLDIPIRSNLQGRTLLPLFRNNNQEFKNYAFSGISDRYSISSKRWQFIYYKNGFKELFDLQEDYNEQRNIADKYPKIVQAHEQELLKWIRTTIRPVANVSAEHSDTNSRDLRELLKRAGYW